MNRYSIEGFTPLELLQMLQRRAALHRAQPVVDHIAAAAPRRDARPTPTAAKLITGRMLRPANPARRGVDTVI